MRRVPSGRACAYGMCMSELDFSQAAFTKAAKSVAAFTEDGTWEDGALDYLNTFYDDARQNEYLDLDRDALLDLARRLWEMGAQRKAGARVIVVETLPHTDQTLIGIVMDDQAFLVDSIIAAISSFGVEVHGLFHPIVSGYRSSDGGWVGRADGTAISESVVGVVIPTQSHRRTVALREELDATLRDVVCVNSDFAPMRERLGALAAEIGRRHGVTPSDEVAEGVAFLDWMRDGNFVLMGARDYDYGVGSKDESYSEPRASGELGLLRDGDRLVLRQSNEPSIISSNVETFLKNAPVVSLAKSNLHSRVHRRVRMDYVSVKRFDAEGRIVGETRIVGLLTSEAYSRSAWDIPLVRRKLHQVLATSDVIEGSHKYNRLKYVLASYPRDELFQIGVTDLARIGTSVAQAFDRPRTRVFLRRDPFDRFVSVLVYTPREQYSTRVRERIGDYLADTFNGRVSAFYPQYSDAPMARVHFIIGLDPDAGVFPTEDALERAIAVIVRPWEQSLLESAERDDADALIAPFVRGFPVAYREAFGVEDALADARILATLAEPGEIAVRVTRLDTGERPDMGIRLYHRGDRLEPSNTIPILENFALHIEQETGYPVKSDSGMFWIHDYDLYVETAVEDAEAADLFEAAFLATWQGRNVDDGFNRLVLPQAARWRDVAFLRLCASFRRQTGLDPARARQIEALETHPALTALLIRLFHARFQPDAFETLEARDAAVDAIVAAIEAGLEAVASLDHDQIIRRMARLIGTSLRTNFHQTGADGAPKPYISLKIDSPALDALPAPKPYREIYVSGPRVDGVHLRFGPIARGGLRWSDRRDDFRAEVLGLVKAQQVKNSVIVPVGSKGGFFPKFLTPGMDRQARQDEAIRAYTTFISGLLDITDTYRGDAVVHPADTVMWDGDDPYLVVAADKGTATFSDIANGIARDYGFWLDDAFASGGSAGYDHKEMGITARGAWEAVKRHFREIGTDIQSEDFTVVGVGDMSGDVFGNGMLLSRHIRLQAAFNHLHIFIDPDPDPARSFAERERLFEMERSTWADYDTSLISEGGGVFDRSAKSVVLTPQIKALTGLTEDEVTPDRLIHALLKVPADLLWFGGIGTYVKASSESDAEVRDKANDRLRVDADEVRAKVVGEGANLGMTQAARIEYARHGGRLNTDAVDNSAGVDSSDHEVNIKILLNGAIDRSSLAREDRDALLESMTEEVAGLVLAHNYDQTAILSLMQARAVEDHDAYARFMRELEKDDALDRAVEGLPSSEEMIARADDGLTRPELAVLLAYAKNEAYKDLMATDFDRDPAYRDVLEAYFPDQLSTFGAAMDAHRLRKEIIASRMVNLMIDVCGPLFLPRLHEQSRADIGAVADAFLVAFRVLDIARLREAVSALDNLVSAAAQLQLADEIAQVIERVTAWMLRNGDPGTIAERVERRADTREIVDAAWLKILSPYDRRRAENRIQRFGRAGIPDALATDVALLRSRASSFDVIRCAQRSELDVRTMAKLFYRVGARFKIDRVRAALIKLEPASHWDALALRHIQEELFAAQSDFATRIARGGLEGESLEAIRAAIAHWIAESFGDVEAYDATVSDLIASRDWTVAKFSIVTTSLQGLRERLD